MIVECPRHSGTVEVANAAASERPPASSDDGSFMPGPPQNKLDQCDARYCRHINLCNKSLSYIAAHSGNSMSHHVTQSKGSCIHAIACVQISFTDVHLQLDPKQPCRDHPPCRVGSTQPFVQSSTARCGNALSE